MSCRSCPLDDPQSLWRNGWVLSKKSCKNLFPQPTLFQKKRLTTWSLKTLHKNAIQKKTFTMNYGDQSKRHPICRGKLLSAHQGGAGRRCYGATCLTWNRSIGPGVEWRRKASVDRNDCVWCVCVMTRCQVAQGNQNKMAKLPRTSLRSVKERKETHVLTCEHIISLNNSPSWHRHRKNNSLPRITPWGGHHVHYRSHSLTYKA